MSEQAIFRDRFGDAAAGYAAYRPRYPASLFDAVTALAPGGRMVWDCGTGSGQAALELAARFDRVAATDASARQIASAMPHPRVTYHVARAQASGLPAGSADLVTVAQALHWFPLEAFYAEVRRVLRPGGALAIWTYGRPRIDPAIDRVMGAFYDHTVGPWWPAERRMVDDAYAGISFPFAEQPLPPQEIRHRWTLEHLLEYVRTWSAVIRFRAAEDHDPVTGLEQALRPIWGAAGATRQVVWPLVLRAGTAPRP